MNPLVFWNELAEQPPSSSKELAKARMNAVIDVMSVLRVKMARGPAPQLRSEHPLYGTVLAEQYTIADWLRDTDRERMRVFLKLATSSPLLRSGDREESLDRSQRSQCRVGDCVAQGLHAAWADEELAISIDSDERWQQPWVEARVDSLEDDGDIAVQQVDIRHLSHVAHVGEHEEWLEDRARCSIADGRDLWERRATLLPHLDLCREAERQLADFDAGSKHLQHIVKRLFALNRAVAEWALTERASIGPDFLPYKCTPETPQTLKEEEADHTATRPDGRIHVFRWHVRFTPGAGRLFFDVDPEAGRGIVGYIGIKKDGRLT